MTVLLRDMSIRSLVGRMIDKGRQDVERFHQQVTKTEAEEIAKKQAARPKEIKVTKETKSAKKLKTAVAKAKPAAQTEAKPGAAENPARAKAKADKAAAAAERSVRKLHELGQLSKDQLDLILKTISKG
jgi:activator of HSP90 ATPase